MQSIAIKLAAVSKSPAAAAWPQNELRALIHGVGGSPRRAKRVLKSDPAAATKLAAAFVADMEAGAAFVHAVKAAAERFADYAGQADETEEA